MYKDKLAHTQPISSKSTLRLMRTLRPSPASLGQSSWSLLTMALVMGSLLGRIASAITANLQFLPQKKRLRRPTLGSFMNISLREPYCQPKLENPIPACFKRFMHKQKHRVKTIHKKNQVGEIQPDQSFHKNLAGFRR